MGGIHLARNGGRLAVGGALDGCYQLQTALRALASPAIADPYSPFRPKGSRDGAVATVSLMGVGGVCVASLRRPWRFRGSRGVCGVMGK